ncbi:hypothetical protein [Caulobacter sp. NIBR2454]|nr:hypothetical protein [Caulobacter sp. NIBR2454]
MALKALLVIVAVLAISIGLLLPVPHHDNSAKATSAIPMLNLDRG